MKLAFLFYLRSQKINIGPFDLHSPPPSFVQILCCTHQIFFPKTHLTSTWTIVGKTSLQFQSSFQDHLWLLLPNLLHISSTSVLGVRRLKWRQSFRMHILSLIGNDKMHISAMMLLCFFPQRFSVQSGFFLFFLYFFFGGVEGVVVRGGERHSFQQYGIRLVFTHCSQCYLEAAGWYLEALHNCVLLHNISVVWKELQLRIK